MRYITLVRPGSFGDNVRLDSEGIIQMHSIAHYITEKILAHNASIDHCTILRPQGLALPEECAELFRDEIKIKNTILAVEWLRAGTEEKPKQVVKKLLELSKTHPLVITIGQFHYLEQFPKLLLESTKNPKENFMKFATHPHNFGAHHTNKYGVLIAYDEASEIHGIIQI
jgi:hypothetical protein